VFVAPVGDCLGMDFDAVYIVGMAEGALPARVADDPVLPDEVRLGLGDPDTLPLRGARRLQERREFLSAVSAGHEAVLSYAVADAGRGGQYPSPWFLEEASRLHCSRLSTAELGRLEVRPWLSWVHSLQHGLAYAATISPTDSHDRDMSSLSVWRGTGHAMDQHYLLSHVPILARAVAMEHARTGNGLSEWDGKVPLLKGTQEAGSQVKPVSPTALESWATCPFRYFLSHVLRIEAAESPEELLTIDAMERGSLLHRVLERFMRESLVQGKMPGFGEPWESWHERLLIDIAEDEFVQVEARGITGRRVFWEATQKEMRRDLSAFLEEDNRWRGEEHSRPLWIERQFGMKDEGSLPSVELAMPDDLPVAFHGRIDRVDQCETAPALPAKFIVIDYKFGSAYPFTDMKDDPLGGGRHLQLPVYGLAARAALGTGAAVEALYWFATAKGGFEQKGVNLAEVECRFRDLTSTITRMIGLGLFPANPGTEDRDNCKFCDFKRVCPPDRDMAWERKSQAPELKPYLALSQGAPAEGAEE
ncbi:MAG: PD-(D/E)XK nuclease family protein, partial [Dehalococcoidia bacterium]|nr:PD-(D/E)XK nuclease family protein [Dehalococcoidia bacterium]